ncbi:MAG: RnfH family protein [Acidiferrobacteraceae bacterium]
METGDRRPEVEVVYCGRQPQWRRRVELARNDTVMTVIERSQLLEAIPEIDLARQPVGIFGRPVSLDDPVAPGDRVEIHRPLPMDPKERRRRRLARLP